jgi:hypothetical protein
LNGGEEAHLKNGNETQVGYHYFGAEPNMMATKENHGLAEGEQTTVSASSRGIGVFVIDTFQLLVFTSMELRPPGLARPGRVDGNGFAPMQVERLASNGVARSTKRSNEAPRWFPYSPEKSNVPIVQEYPEDCVPIREGRIVGPIEPWTSALPIDRSEVI